VTTLGIEQPALVSCSEALLESNDEPRVRRLRNGTEGRALKFLARRPAHTAYLAGLIHTNGLESPLNRGSFYACGNCDSKIEGVALIGHAVTFEATNELAAEELARLASKHLDTVLIRGERNQMKRFWRPYAEAGRTTRKTCDEQLLELTVRFPTKGSDYELRPALPDELEQAVFMNAELALAERGNDPLKLDPEGFRRRLLRRIQRRQVWVSVREGKVIFKAEIITRTPEVVYLEGIFVHRDERSKGHGISSMRQLGNLLLNNARSLCLFVNDRNSAARELYLKAGYQTVGHYETIYLHERPERFLRRGAS
jgi:GNAT superfamily N-acetyltransferase